MTHAQAERKLFSVKWKVGYCSQGEKCWCRTIEPVEKITYMHNGEEEEMEIAGAGEVGAKIAEYIVKLHNLYIEKVI